MNVRPLAFCVLGFAYLTLSIVGQGRDDQPPVPVLSSAGTVPAGAENSYVFVDPRTENGVVFYTQDGKPAGTNPFGPSTVRVDIKLSRHVEATVRSEVAYNADTEVYEYRYQLMNGTDARQTAWKWMLDRVDTSNTTMVRTPSSWTYRFPVTQAGGIEIPERFRNADPLLRSLQLVAVDSRGALAPPQGIRAGGTLSGVEVVSRHLPGVIRVLVQGDFNVPTFPDEPPAGASEQVDALVRSVYNYGHTFAIGPRFLPRTANTAIARASLEDLEQLERSNLIAATSAFTTELRGFLQSNDLQSIAGLERASSLAGTPFERELVHGIRLALTAPK